MQPNEWLWFWLVMGAIWSKEETGLWLVYIFFLWLGFGHNGVFNF